MPTHRSIFTNIGNSILEETVPSSSNINTRRITNTNNE